jgi:putative membrane protein insertion efficiency factor
MTRATRLRRAWWLSGVPARALLIGSIRVYRRTLSGMLGGQCRFHPTCSHYGEEAIRVHGALKGSALAAWRIARCGPFSRGGIDEVPPRGASAPRYDGAYDGVSQSPKYDPVTRDHTRDVTQDGRKAPI